MGTVLDSLESPAIGAQITVYAGDTINTNSFTDDNGAYEVLGLEAGSYDVVYEYQEYDSLVSEDIIIVAANATTGNFFATAIQKFRAERQQQLAED